MEALLSRCSSRHLIHLILKKLPENEELLAKKQKVSLFQLAQDITPSSSAKASGCGGWIVKLKKQHPDLINCHRVATDTEVPPLPLALLHPVFGQFQDDCQHIQIGTEDCKFVESLCEALSRSYEDESSFAEAACSLVSSYLDVSFVPSSPRDMPADNPVHHNERCLLHFVCKRARGGSGGDPMMRNIANYLKRLPEHIDRRMPCFLLDLCGPYMALFGMCNTSDTHAVCEPLVCGLPLVRVSDEQFMTSLVRTWASLKKGVAALAAIEDDTTFLDSFKTASGELVRIKYIGHLARRVFEASCSLTNDAVVVKFAKRYSKELHDFCHAHNFSPKLLHLEDIAGGWIFLVMEKVDGLVQIWLSREKLKAKEQLQELSNGLQAEGFVHGDLRESNVMWDSAQSRIVVLDFDWAGIEGVVKYPPLMNRKVRWPRGASISTATRARSC